MTLATLTTTTTSVRSHALSLLMSGLLGAFVIGFVGFSQLDVMHNAGHDYRHSMAFPCH